MTNTITVPALVQQVRAAVIEHYRTSTHNADGTLRPERELPVLMEPGAWKDDDWVLVWDGGPDNWPHAVTMGAVCEFTDEETEPAKLPKGMYCEAVNNVVLGIYLGA